MDLWIRSQDRRKLMPNPNLGIEIIDNEFYITHIINFDDSVYFGKYKTKERALEVLDEISKILEPSKIINAFEIEKTDMLNGSQYRIVEKGISDFSIIQFNTYVYEMPLE